MITPAGERLASLEAKLAGLEHDVHDMRLKLAARDNRFSALIEAIITSPQFLNKRGDNNPTKETTHEHSR